MSAVGVAIETMTEAVEGWTVVLGEDHDTTKAAKRALSDWKTRRAEIQRKAEL